MKSYKYDGRLHLHTDLKEADRYDECLILFGPPKRTLTHLTRDKIFTFDEPSVEVCFSDRWYTAACVFDKQGKEVFWYMNIAQPCSFYTDSVSFVDLDLDIIIESDGMPKVVDMDEFEEHSKLFNYPNAIIERAERAVDEVLNDIEKKVFPFDLSLREYHNKSMKILSNQ